MKNENNETPGKKNRHVLAEITVIAFVAVAFHESLNTFRESLDTSGFPWKALGIFALFFLTMLRFFIGNHLHLQNPVLLARERRAVWLADFLVILVESAMLGFLASISPLMKTNMSSFDFVNVLEFLYAFDVFWIVVQACQRRWRWVGKQPSMTWLPWHWAILNTVLLLFTVWLQNKGDIYGKESLWWMVTVNGIAFIIDLRLALPILLGPEEAAVSEV